MDFGKGPIRVGIIGCGRISQSYFDAIQQCPELNLSAVMDVRSEAAQAMAEQSNAVAFDNIESYLEKGNTQASILCTPPLYHKSIACQLLEAGQNVLCEKPLAKTLEESLLMMDTAKKHKRHLMMASKFRYVNDVIKAKGIISSGLLGKLIYYENCFSGQVNMAERWNSNPEVSGGGVVVDNGTHSVDIVRYLLGPIQSVRTMDMSSNPNRVIEDTALLSFITTSGINGAIHLSWNFSIDRNAYIGIYGADGRMRVNWDEASYQYNRNPQWIPFGYGYNKVEAFKKQILNFVGTITGTAEPLIKDTDCLASVAVIEAAYRSLKSGKWENVDAKFA